MYASDINNQTRNGIFYNPENPGLHPRYVLLLQPGGEILLTSAGHDIYMNVMNDISVTARWKCLRPIAMSEMDSLTPKTWYGPTNCVYMIFRREDIGDFDFQKSYWVPSWITQNVQGCQVGTWQIPNLHILSFQTTPRQHLKVPPKILIWLPD